MEESAGSDCTTRGTGEPAAGTPLVLSEELDEDEEEDEEVCAKAAAAPKNSETPRSSETPLRRRPAVQETEPGRSRCGKEDTQGFSTIGRGLGKPRSGLGPHRDSREGDDGTAADGYAEGAGRLEDAAQQLAFDLSEDLLVLRAGDDAEVIDTP
jgi:hypothetical protein